MPEHSSNSNISKIMVLLLKEGNTIRDVINDTESDKKVFIFAHTMTPALRRKILKEKKYLMTYEEDFFKFTAKDSLDTILIPRNDTIYLNVKHLFKTSYGKNAAVTILLLNGLLIGFGLLYLDSYLSQHNLSFLFHEIVGYVSSNGMIAAEVALITFMVSIGTLFYPSPLMFDPLVTKEVLSLKKNIVSTLTTYLISGLAIIIYILLLPAGKNNISLATLACISLLPSPICMFLWNFKTVKATPEIIFRLLALNAKFILQLAIGVIMLMSVAPTLFKVKYIAVLTIAALTSMFAFTNLTKALSKGEIKNKYLRFSTDISTVLFVIMILVFIFWIQPRIDIIKSWHLGNYNQSLAINEQLSHYPDIIKQLNYDAAQQTIKPWVVLQTDKILVVAKDKSSKQLFYFRKYPYSLISHIDLLEHNAEDK